MNVAVVIPAFNPEGILVDYIAQLKALGFKKFIIVDDGSSPDSRPVFNRIEADNDCFLLRHEANRGKGRALKTAFSFFLNSDEFASFKGLVTRDADGQHHRDDVKKVAQTLLSNPGSFVLGARDFDSDNVPFKSKKGNKITRGVMQALFSKRITDTQTGLRGLDRDFTEKCLGLKGDRFEYEMRMLILGMRTCNIKEVTIQTIYFNQNRATSFRAVADSVKIYRVILSNFLLFTLSSLSSSLIDVGLFTLLLIPLDKMLPEYKAIVIATVVARVVSSAYNYLVNRNLIFKNKDKSFKSVVRYYALVVLIMALSAGSVRLVYYITKFNKSLIKIAVDTLLFLLSYKAQQMWVFK